MRLQDPPFILTLSCRDAVGIVADVTGFLARHGGFIVDSQQYADLETGRFFMRVAFVSGSDAPLRLDALRAAFAAVGSRHAMDWTLSDSAERARLVIAVSKHAHCLYDLLHRWSTGALPVEVVAVVSNHPDMRSLTEWHGIPYHHLPVTADNRAAQEAQIAALVEETRADIVVLARYMQVLSPELTARLAGRCINIHHSFLPSFKGAKPYHRAHARGVKLIGATAHYVTSDLDEGPIIEQAVERVDHRDSIDDLVRIGRDIEAQVLARAVKWQAERRVVLNGAKTVMFR
ncbi:formyltetrahydrofolate deformylase [Sphingoaurantiacus capsulatus]|uniref:Formyltetrahydrofolate deformylase n=1 Tax=Sphingoaurantiacus capsulatus TaxID=1771310 RepID=A0ABV7X931_9SPHN